MAQYLSATISREVIYINTFHAIVSVKALLDKKITVRFVCLSNTFQYVHIKSEFSEFREDLAVLDLKQMLVFITTGDEMYWFVIFFPPQNKSYIPCC